MNSTAVKMNSTAVKMNSTAVKMNSTAVKMNSTAVKMISTAVKMISTAVKMISTAVYYRNYEPNSAPYRSVLTMSARLLMLRLTVVGFGSRSVARSKVDDLCWMFNNSCVYLVNP